MVRVFRSMLQERLVLCIFALQVIRPAQDLAPLVTSKFGAGAAFVASITSVRSTFRMLLPLTPVIPMLHAALGGGTRDPKTGEVVGGDRPVAAVMCVAMALLGALVPLCPNLVVLQVVMAAKGLANVIKESTVSAIMSSLASHGNVGAFFGWQHFMKGLAGVTSHMVTGLLVSRGPEHPYFATAACDLLYALIYVFA
ncbi:hypothetical protein JKP88DRAFT_226076 [Tribonema minus]|uniref:Uncharacterized protein n=1 Tax=Tribonema minus TaxID=303371 RepID=A0A835YM00_9STRA|nr:hypothetical protein JKP88DRAFT_226076 [Tribonema minus]